MTGVSNTRNSDGGIVAILDSSRKIDEWNVDNITLNGNLIPTTDNDGNLLIHKWNWWCKIPDDSRIGFGGGANGITMPWCIH